MSIGPWTHEEFMEKARQFHGYPAPGLIIAGYMVDMAHKALPDDILFDAICESGQCIPDAVQILTPCTIGNGWLRIYDFGLFALCLFDKQTGKGVRVHLDTHKLTAYPEIRSWFFKEKPKKEQDTPRLQEEIRQAGDSILTLRAVQIRPENLVRKSKGAVIICPTCQECFPAAHGDTCLSCQGQSPY